MAIDYAAAAMDALATWLASVTGVAGAQRGWPEHNESLDLSAGPVATVTMVGRPVPNDCAPARIPELDSNDAGTLTVTYRVGWPVIRLQVDLWAAYRSQRDDAVAAIEGAREAQLPAAGLWLTSTGYHNRPLTVLFLTGPETTDESDAATVGEWRASWDVEIHTDRIATTTHPQQGRVDLSLDLDGDTVTIEDLTG